MKLSIAVITLNEERNIGRCLRSLQFSRSVFQEMQIVVVDAESHDNTVQIATAMGAEVFVRPWNGYADQRNWILGKCVGDWILILDADEELTPELIKEIESKIPATSTAVNGYNIAVRNLFCAKWIGHCGWYPGYQLRLLRQGTGHYPYVHVHEGLVVRGKRLCLVNPMNHYSHDSIRHYLEKLNRYTDLEIIDMPSKGIRYCQYHMLVAPLRRFLGMYFKARGFLDGWHGFVVCALAAFSDFITYVKLWERDLLK